MDIAAGLKASMPGVIIIYGGVFPTYQWREVLERHLCVDIIVRGEGEETVVNLTHALQHKQPLAQVNGIAFRWGGDPVATPPAAMITDLDAYRIGWEVIDHADYSYWGGKRAVVMQFSRGCPHLCTYCGQRGFWTKWRHRDPVKFAAEIARLYREHGVELINLADENPTSSKRQWRAFLEAMIAENVPVSIIGSTRADDIVRDRDHLHLYKKAGVLRFLMGIETTDAATLTAIQKGSMPTIDRKAIAALREHGIISLCTFAVGFAEETDRDYWQMLRQLITYDPDQILSVYATPHAWTPFYRTVRDRKVVETDLSRWDYKHQVLAVENVPRWRVFLWVKAIEALVQGRPRSVFRVLAHRDRDVRAGMRWYTRMGRRVWIYEFLDFAATVWRDLVKDNGRPAPAVDRLWFGRAELPENAMTRPVSGPPPALTVSQKPQ